MSDDLIISDTSSLILLDKIGEINLLRQVFHQVYITSVIVHEFGNSLPEWIVVKDCSDPTRERRLALIMDEGEASVLALAAEMGDCYVLLDDNKARRYAQATKQKYVGTLGLLLRAKRQGVIPLVRPILEKIMLTDFRTTESLYEFVLNEAGE